MTQIPKKMRAMVLTGHGGMDKLVFHDDWPTPQPQTGEALIRVRACGMNNTDVNTRIGWYARKNVEPKGPAGNDKASAAWDGASLGFPRIQGGDVVGEVVAFGPDTDTSLLGRRVLVDTILRDWADPLNLEKCGYLGSEADGGFAEYMKIDTRNLCPIDCDLPDADLATFAISYSTAENMLNRAKVTKDDTVLIPGASGGVGSALIQLANRRGATTIAMASPDKHADVALVGPDHILPRSPDNLAHAIFRATGRETVSVVADIVGGDGFSTRIEALERGGRFTCSGAIAGAEVTLDLRTLYLRDLTFTGCTILPPEVFPTLVGYIERGEIRPLRAATYPLEHLHQGQQAFIDKKHTGNIVVTI